MQSDARVERTLAVVAATQAQRRAGVAAAADQIGDYLDARRPPAGGDGASPVRLGRFAAGRISEARFASLFDAGPLVPGSLQPVERAAAVLADVLGPDAAASHTLPPGGDLARLVEEILTRTGRAFGAALVFQAARVGAYRSDQHDRLLDGIPFGRWNRSERQLAPPLVIAMDGADARADGLAAFMDGGLKIVLVIDGPCPPAPLVRLITPGVFVMQTADPADLERLMAFDGPGIAALVPDAAARFVHDPAAGDTLAGRLTIQHLPTDRPRTAVGGRSTWQQQDELAALTQLAAVPAVASSAVPAVASSSVDTLASWLLSQAGLAPAAEAPMP